MTTEMQDARAARQVMAAASASSWRHTCAVCPRPVQRGVLMCLAHWKLVPHFEQQEVYRSWGALQRLHQRNERQSFVTTRKAYFEARDRAIESAKARIDQPSGEALS